MNRRRVGEDRGSKEMDGCPLTAWRRSGGWTVYTEQARAAETASGVDRDNEERIETRRLTGTQSDVIQFNSMFL
jgi:hypothetical protein